jgi:hypothetical protein
MVVMKRTREEIRESICMVVKRDDGQIGGDRMCI